MTSVVGGTPFVGEDTFTYTVADGRGGTDTATVTVTVSAPREPAYDLLVEACQDPVDAFDDDDGGSVHEPAIDCLAALGLLQGDADGDVRPAEDVTRGQAAAIVLRLLEAAREATIGQLCPEGFDTFADTAGSVFELPIGCLAELGVVSGFPDGTYRAGLEVSRAQLASLLARAVDQLGGSLPVGDTGAFSDVSAGDPHAEAIASLAAADVLHGLGHGSFGPWQPLTRGQLASSVERLVRHLHAQAA